MVVVVVAAVAPRHRFSSDSFGAWDGLVAEHIFNVGVAAANDQLRPKCNITLP